jgi:hypothetical protein
MAMRPLQEEVVKRRGEELMASTSSTMGASTLPFLDLRRWGEDGGEGIRKEKRVVSRVTCRKAARKGS